MAGRHGKMNDEVVKTICDGIKLGMTYDLAARRAGIAKRTFHSWMQKGREQQTGHYVRFRHSVKEAEAQGLATSLASIHKAARGHPDTMPCPQCAHPIAVPKLKPDWHAAAWIAERRHGYTRDGKLHQESLQASGDIAGDLTPEQFLEVQLREIRTMTAKAQQDGSHQAVAALQRQARDIHQQLHKLKAKRDDGAAVTVDPYAEVTDGKLAAMLVQSVATLPEWVLIRLETAIDRRRDGPNLRIVGDEPPE